MKWNESKSDNNFKYKTKISHNFYYRYFRKILAIICIKYTRSTLYYILNDWQKSKIKIEKWEDMKTGIFFNNII